MALIVESELIELSPGLPLSGRWGKIIGEENSMVISCVCGLCLVQIIALDRISYHYLGYLGSLEK